MAREDRSDEVARTGAGHGMSARAKSEVAS